MPSVYVKTLGCKVNSYDTDALSQQLQDAGFLTTNRQSEAQVTIVNTCSVTMNADKEALYLARRYRRENPDSLLVFTGCYAQTDSQRLLDEPKIDLVVPNEAKPDLVQLVRQNLDAMRDGSSRIRFPANLKKVKDNRQGHFKSSVFFGPIHQAKTRAFIKVQDGCNGFCSYCLIPYARGASRSVPVAAVVDEVTRVVLTGTKEVVLTGIHIGDYGEDLDGSETLTSLLKRLTEIRGLERIRISSLEPGEVSDEMLAFMQTQPHRFCDHFHLPLQSGCDRILKLMRRTYNKEQYADAVHRIRAVFPDASIGADIIPGFPSETELEHQESLEFICELNLSYLHVFPYSRRPNTAANKMPDHVDGNVVKQRSKDLRDLSQQLKKDYAKNFIGKHVNILWLNEKDSRGRTKGITSNYLDIVSDHEVEIGSISIGQSLGFVEQGNMLARPALIQ